jgi:hypothetical protein
MMVPKGIRGVRLRTLKLYVEARIRRTRLRWAAGTKPWNAEMNAERR